jgi:hypothetical protein
MTHYRLVSYLSGPSSPVISSGFLSRSAVDRSSFLSIAMGLIDMMHERLAELRSAVELAPDESGMRTSLARALAAKGLAAEGDQEVCRAQHPTPR